MSNGLIRREIECLERLHSVSPVYEELLAFLRLEHLLSDEELKAIRTSPEKSKLLQANLAKLSRNSKLQLLSYEWTLLPVERIKITVVTDSVHKEFLMEI